MAQKKLVEKYGKKTNMQLLRQVLLIRRFEERAAQAYGLRKIGGFCHLYIGEEAVAGGAITALDMARDYVVAAYRDHGHALATGMDPKGVMAELYGKATGCSKGKGGSMHMFDREKHMFGGNGIVGGQIPVATGVGLKIKYKEEEGVVLGFFGDGAIHQGSFHESMNLAKIYGLPVIYICENNHYGMGTDFRRVSSVHDFSQMADAYGIEGRQINGMDPLVVYDEVTQVVEKVRKDSTPMFLEMLTYRYKGHSMSDPAKYRTKDELQEYKDQDPLTILQKQMSAAGQLSDKDFEKLDKEIRDICAAAADFAEESPEPELSALYEDVLVE
jgi:pyruvate dehydrogenase E1 component alpha subunit